jgi:hypothetical protein
MAHRSIRRSSVDSRRSSRRAFVVGRALAAVALVAGAAACGRLTPVEHRGGQEVAAATANVPGDPEAVRAALASALGGEKRALPEKWKRFKLARAGDDYFPRDDQLAHEQGDEALARYLERPAAARRGDLFFYDFSDADDPNGYWPSEYYAEGRQIPFRSNFLIALQPSADGKTAVEVLEVSPRVWVGSKFSFEAHGPGFHLDIRNVPPTNADRVELLRAIRTIAGG